ncbi:MAG: hypothetical protein AAGE43_08065 [Pseudomonadota bacterium]
MGAFAPFAVRDALIVAVVLTAWWLFYPVTVQPAFLADTLGLLLGLGAALVVYLLHEWGHLLAALASGGTAYPPARLKHPSLFSFDVERNDKRQFTLMSLGGFAVTAVAIYFFFFVLPGAPFEVRVARAGVALLASITLFVEVPLLLVGLLLPRIPSVVAVFRVAEDDLAPGSAPGTGTPGP